MKKITILILFSVLFSCKKENEPPPTAATHNIKYQVLGFIDTDITYDGTHTTIHNNFDWSYDFAAPTGKALSLSAFDMSGTQSITIRIFQDGTMTKSAAGYGVQSLTDIVK